MCWHADTHSDSRCNVPMKTVCLYVTKLRALAVPHCFRMTESELIRLQLIADAYPVL